MDTLMRIEPEVYENVPKAFERTKETLNEDVEIIREWLKTQPHLPELMSKKSDLFPIDLKLFMRFLEDVYIKNFLVLNKCSIEKTKQKIDLYYTVRSLLPEIYEKVNPKTTEFQSMMKAVNLNKTYVGVYRVCIRRFRDTKLHESLGTNVQLGSIFNIFEVRLKEDYMFGDVLIFDVKSITVGTITQVTPAVMAKCVFIYEKVFSMRVKAMYVVNAPPFIGTLMALLKTVIKPKIFGRIQISTDDTILPEVIPVDILPKDYGGNEKSIDELKALWFDKFKQYQDRFDKLDTMRVKEELRPEKLTNDEMLGFHGNFKKLVVD